MDGNMYGAVQNGQQWNGQQCSAPAEHCTPMPQQPDKFVPVNCDEAMSLTSLSDLQSYARGTIVRFPDFAEGQPFVARVRRPSMLVLAKQGKIPNSLLTAAGSMFAKGGDALDADDEDMLGNVFSVCEVIARASLKEPTYDDIINAGMELSDEQMMAIFSYVQSGVKALESFRKE